MINISDSTKDISIFVKRISSIIPSVGRWLCMIIDNVEIWVVSLLERELVIELVGIHGIQVGEKIGLVVQ